MSDPVSALDGASFDGIVRIADAGLQGMITVRGDLTSGGMVAAVSQALGVSVPEKSCVENDGARWACWMSPDELLILLPYDDVTGALTAMSEALKGEHALVVDVSDARASFRIEGEGALIRETLAKLTPADMRAAALPVGILRRTRLAQVPAAFWLQSEGAAHLICFRSVASYIFGILKHAATPGSEAGFFR